MKKSHPVYTNLWADSQGNAYYDNGSKIPTFKLSTRETFCVKNEGKSLNFGLRRFIWECMTGKVVDRKYIVRGKGDSNKFEDLELITKSQQASEVYTNIWRKKRNEI